LGFAKPLISLGEESFMNSKLETRVQVVSAEVLAMLNRRALQRNERSKTKLSSRGFGLQRSRHFSSQNPGVPGQIDVIDWTYYDSASFAASAAMANTVFFQVPISGTKLLNATNLQGTGGQLPFPQTLTITALKVYIANNTVPADLQNLLTNVSYTLTVGLKPFFQCPLAVLSAGMGGIVTAAANLGTVPAGSAPLFTTSNGIPDPRCVYGLNKPIIIGYGENFNVTLTPNVAFNFAANSTNPAGVGTSIVIHLDGILTRQVQ
jgi:hypothetical protein